MKTKSAVKKRFKLMGSGIIKMGQAGKRHCMRKRASRMIRNSRGLTAITPCEIRRVARGLVVGASRIKPKSNKKMMQNVMSNMSIATMQEALQTQENEGEVLNVKS